MKIIDNLNKNRQVPKSKTTTFLLPILLSKGKTVDLFLKEGFENCYIYDDNKLIVVYKITKDNSDLDEKLKDHELFEKSIDIQDGNKVGYIFNLPDKYQDDKNLILEGKYTEISTDLKETILDFWGLSESQNYIQGILYGTKLGKEYYDKELANTDSKIAENEFFPIPNSEIEYFNSMYKE